MTQTCRLSNSRKSLIALLASVGLACTLGFPLSSPNPLAQQVRPVAAFVYPLMTPRISSNFGKRFHPIRHFSKDHSGIDLAAPAGSVIRSISKGVVIFADEYAGYGKFVVIKHDKSFTTHYGHCSEIKVHTGQIVKSGQIIALVGTTGQSTGPHLHFETRVNGVPYDPEIMLPGLAKEAEG